MAGVNATTASLAAQLAQVQSRTCTPSSDARCSSAALKATFGSYVGILAAYCNDNFLVVYAKGLPNHPTSLGSILTPPGGSCNDGSQSCGYGGQCVTRNYFSSLSIYKFPLVPTLLTTASGTVNNAGLSFNLSQLAVATSLGVGDMNNLMYFNGQSACPCACRIAYAP